MKEEQIKEIIQEFWVIRSLIYDKLTRIEKMIKLLDRKEKDEKDEK